MATDPQTKTTPAPTPSSSSTTAVSFFDAVLNKLGAPVTPANERLFAAWAHAEGTAAAFNPLATTLPEPGASNFNSIGVKNYVSSEQGAAATAATIAGGGYGTILQDLRQNSPVSIVSTPAGWADLNRWVSGQSTPTRSSYVTNIQSDFGAEKSAYSGFGFGNSPSQGGITGALSAPGAAVTGAATGAASAVTGAVGQITGWISQYAVRGLEIGAGAALVILGITIVGKGIVASTPAQATASAARSFK